MHFDRFNFEDTVRNSGEIWKEASFWLLLTFVQDAVTSCLSPPLPDYVVNIMSSPVYSGPRKDVYRKGKKKKGKLSGWGIRSDYQGTDLNIILRCGVVLSETYQAISVTSVAKLSLVLMLVPIFDRV